MTSTSGPDSTNIQNTKNESVKMESSSKPTSNLHALLLNRHKKPLGAKNNLPSSQVPSTPSNIKRLQVNKWFNSPTDNMFSPCSKKLYKKNYQPIAGCNLTNEMIDSSDANPTENIGDQLENQ